MNENVDFGWSALNEIDKLKKRVDELEKEVAKLRVEKGSTILPYLWSEEERGHE